MCGIVAIVSKSGRPVSGSVLATLTEELIHRGPDDAGLWIEPWCGLGFRRLSIVDLSNDGHQPMFDAAGRYAIVYNGELYNFEDLRRELAVAGVVFRSRSDTEVVLQSFIRHGPSCVEAFEGMFAFVIVDRVQREVFFARDQLGIKPFYYAETADFLFVSSEIKNLRSVISFELNNEVLQEQILYRSVAGSATLLRNVHKLPPGFRGSMGAGSSPRFERYYDVTRTLGQRREVDEAEALEEIERALIRSIKRHTMGDVGYCIQLSGGVDSSYVTAVLRRDLGISVPTFSVAFDDECDESPYQQEVVSRYGTQHHEVRVDEVMFADALERTAWHNDMPMFVMGSVPLMVLGEHIAPYAKVVLAGEGADELFGGYFWYQWSNEKSTEKRVQQKVLEAHLFGKKRGQMLSYFLPVAAGAHGREEVFRELQGFRTKLLAYDQTQFLPMVLNRQDKVFMASSIESRVPLCNHRLFELVNPLCEELKFKAHGGQAHTPKYLLKRIAEKDLSHDLIHRPKVGLHIPKERWLTSGPLSERLDLLTDKTARERGLYQYDTIARAVAEQRSATADHSSYLMYILFFEIWARLYLDDPFRFKPRVTLGAEDLRRRIEPARALGPLT